ncbi:hypothetical protein [Pedobacter panaciterrae]
MQNFQKTETRRKIAFVTKIEDVPGGVGVAVADLVQSFVPEATVLGKDSNGLYHVVVTAKLTADATNTATTYQVTKGHNFKVGKFLASDTGAKAYAITDVNTSNANYDVLTVGTTLGVALTAGAVLIEAVAEATGTQSAFKYIPELVSGNGFDVIPGDNHVVDAWRRATVIEANAAPVHAKMKAAMQHIIYV